MKKRTPFIFVLGTSTFLVILLLVIKKPKHQTPVVRVVEQSKPIEKQRQLASKTSSQRSVAQVTKTTSKGRKTLNWQQDPDSRSRLKKLDRCYHTEGLCGFEQKDPKSEYFAIGQQIKKELLKIQYQVSNENQQSGEIRDLALHYLKSPDGHVKEAALHLLATQPVSEQGLEALLNDILAFHDASLIAPAMLELTRYLNQGSDERIHDALITALLTGSPLVSEQVAKNISPFISAQSLEQYQKLLEKMSLGSVTYQNLKASLQEFTKKQTAA